MADRPILDDIARTVRSVRRAQGLDQRELAMVAGVATRTVSRVENGHPTVQVDGLLRVLDALGIELRIEAPE